MAIGHGWRAGFWFALFVVASLALGWTQRYVPVPVDAGHGAYVASPGGTRATRIVLWHYRNLASSMKQSRIIMRQSELLPK